MSASIINVNASASTNIITCGGVSATSWRARIQPGVYSGKDMAGRGAAHNITRHGTSENATRKCATYSGKDMDGQ